MFIPYSDVLIGTRHKYSTTTVIERSKKIFAVFSPEFLASSENSFVKEVCKLNFKKIIYFLVEVHQLRPCLLFPEISLQQSFCSISLRPSPLAAFSKSLASALDGCYFFVLSAQTAELKNQSWKNLGRAGIWTRVNWVRSTNATYLTSIIFFKWWIKLCLSSAHQSVWVKSKKFRHLIFFQLAYDCLGSTKFVPIFYRSFKIPSYVKVQPLFCRSEANGYQMLFSCHLAYLGQIFYYSHQISIQL